MSTAYETATYIGDISAPATYPADSGASGKRANSAAEQRKLKDILVDTLGSLTGAVTSTHTELNLLDGVTASTADINTVAGLAAGGNDIDNFPAGTAMLFYQDAAPTGWSIVTAVDEHVVRLTGGEDVEDSAAGGTSDGTYDFVNCFTTVLGPGDGFATGVGAHELTLAEIPAHTHTTTSGGGILGVTAGALGLPTTADDVTGSAGSGDSHIHTCDLRVKWSACIIATKDP